MSQASFEGTIMHYDSTFKCIVLCNYVLYKLFNTDISLKLVVCWVVQIINSSQFMPKNRNTNDFSRFTKIETG